MQKKSKILAAIALGLGLVAGGVALWHLTRPAPRSVVALTPIGPDEAILVSHDQGAGVTRRYLQLVHAKGAKSWDHELSSFAPLRGSDRPTVTTDETRIYVLGEDADGVSILALDRHTGDEIWRAPVAIGVKQDVLTAELQLDGARLLAFHTAKKSTNNHKRETITGLDATTGEVIWPKDEVARHFGSPLSRCSLIEPGRLICSGLMVHDGAAWVTREGAEIDTASGAIVRSVSLITRPQFTPAGLLANGPDGFYLIPKSTGGPITPKPIVDRSNFIFGSLHSITGLFEDLVVFVATPRIPSNEEIHAEALVGVDRTTKVVRWSLELPVTSIGDDFKSIDGVLPRHLPFVTSKVERDDAGELEDHQELVVVDLKTGEVVFKEARAEHLDIVVAGAWAVLYEHNLRRLFSFDPARRALVPLPTPRYFEANLTPEALKYNQLWYYGDTYSSSDDLPWGVIDIPTWKVIHENGVFVRDQPGGPTPTPATSTAH